ncbi:MAG: DUF5752 family protein [Dehalococcoidia bacterium]
MTVKIQKPIIELWLRDVPENKAFWFHNGRTAKNLAELASALREIREETFEHHVLGDRNDFSNWVKDVIGDVTLANQLQKAATQAAAARRVETRLDWLKARL